jgi:hypothetical protein
LKQIFLKYCTPRTTNLDPSSLPPNAFMSPASLDKWVIDTNGSPLPDEEKEEIKEFVDVNEDGNLTSVIFFAIPNHFLLNPLSN